MNTYPVLNSVERKVVERIPEGSEKILIFGCDDGRLFTAIRKRFEGKPLFLAGVGEKPEVAEEARATCDQLLVRPVEGTSAGDFDPDHLPFDVLIYADLEKAFADPFLGLARQKDLLKQGGKAFFAFQNAQFIGTSAALVNAGLLFDFLSYQDLASRHPMTFAIAARILSMLGFVPGYVFAALSEHYTRWKEKPAEPFTSERLRVEIKNDFEAFQLFAYLMVLEADNRPGDPERDKGPEIQYQMLAIGDIRSVRYRRPREYWRRQGEEFLLLQKAGVRLPSEPDPNALALARKVASLTPQPKSVLLIGCGFGRHLKALRCELPQARLVGLDPSEPLIRAARDYLATESVELLVHPVEEKLPFEDDSFDAVVTGGILSMVYPDCLAHLLKEIRRVSCHFAVHDEDMRRNDPRIMGYNLAEIYVKAGTKTTFEKDPTSQPPQQLQLVVAEVKGA